MVTKTIGTTDSQCRKYLATSKELLELTVPCAVLVSGPNDSYAAYQMWLIIAGWEPTFAGVPGMPPVWRHSPFGNSVHGPRAGFIMGLWQFNAIEIPKAHQALALELKAGINSVQVVTYYDWLRKAQNELNLDELFVDLITLQRALSKKTKLSFDDGVVVVKIDGKSEAKGVAVEALPRTVSRELSARKARG